MRPAEGGRCVILRFTPDHRIHDVLAPPWNARTRVHEYGGGAYKVHHMAVYFTHLTDQRIYVTTPDGSPAPITPPLAYRYADFTFDAHRQRLICVREDHSRRCSEPRNTLISMTLDGGDVQTIVAGGDFYSSPRISPDGRTLAWITWNHPAMPWDHTTLWVGSLGADHTVRHPIQVAGVHEESIVQPRWSPENVLYFISDRSNWWNLYRWTGDEVTPICPTQAEYATPPWLFAQSNYVFVSENVILCSYATMGRWHLGTIDTETGDFRELPTPYTQINNLQILNRTAVFLGGSPSDVPAIVAFDLDTDRPTVVRRSSDVVVDARYVSTPTPMEFPTEGGRTAHAFYYAPRNPDFRAPEDERPPLLVCVHGGPTAAASTTLSWTTQFWTSRGFAVIDVNYGGSSGFGRAYRQRLNGCWGVVDVEDCVNAATYLVNAGLVDGERLAIRGGSAGGYTTITAATFRSVFNAGASYYGISDLEVFRQDTHKFESRYLETLVGRYPEHQARYHDRSALQFLDQLKTPLILFQGLEDPIVPSNQAEMIVDALKRHGQPVAYVPFVGEQHGFRRADSIQRSLEAELYFYAHIFGFPVDRTIEPILIHNL